MWYVIEKSDKKNLSDHSILVSHWSRKDCSTFSSSDKYNAGPSSEFSKSSKNQHLKHDLLKTHKGFNIDRKADHCPSAQKKSFKMSWKAMGVRSPFVHNTGGV